MSAENKFITRWSGDFQGNLQEDPNGSWVLAADAAIRDKRLTDKIDALQALLTAADERADVLERDKARIDWLADQPVDTLYLDDGRIIDIAGRVDLRDAIDAAMASPRPAEGGDDDLDDHDRSSQAYWADQAAQGKPYEQQLREACERNGIAHGLDEE